MSALFCSAISIARFSVRVTVPAPAVVCSPPDAKSKAFASLAPAAIAGVGRSGSSWPHATLEIKFAPSSITAARTAGQVREFAQSQYIVIPRKFISAPQNKEFPITASLKLFVAQRLDRLQGRRL